MNSNSFLAPFFFRILVLIVFYFAANPKVHSQTLGPMEESFNLFPWTSQPISNPTKINGPVFKDWTRSSSDSVNFSWELYSGGTNSPFNTGPKGGNPDFSGNYFAIKSDPAISGLQTASLITPTVNVSFVPDPHFEFYYHIHGPCVPDLIVEIDDGSGWQQVFQTSGSSQNSQSEIYKRFKLDLSGFGNFVKARFRANLNSPCGGIIAIDDVSFKTIPCDKVDNVSAKILANYDLQLNWSPVGNANTYSVFLVPQSIPNAGPSNQFIASIGTDTSALISNLPLGECYDVYIKTNCPNLIFSNYSNPIETCIPDCQPQSIPYFNNLSHWPANCWKARESHGFENTNGFTTLKGEELIRSRNSFPTPTISYIKSPWIQMDNRKCNLKFKWTRLISFPQDTLKVFARFFGDPNELEIFNINGANFTDSNSSAANPIGVEQLIPLDSSLFSGKLVEFTIYVERGFNHNIDLYLTNFSIEPLAQFDVDLVTAEFIGNTICSGANDSILIHLCNKSDSTLNLLTKPLNISYKINGPVNSLGSEILSHGIIAPNDTIAVLLDGIDRTKAGIYNFEYLAIETNNYNELPSNDSLFLVQNNESIVGTLELEPNQIAIVTDTFSQVPIKANSSIFTNGDFVITEICQSKQEADAPIGGWPSYLSADRFIEVSGKPGLEILTIYMEVWSETGLIQQRYFSGLTKPLGPNGTAIIGLEVSVNDSPTNYYYSFATQTSAISSNTGIGYILKKSPTEIVDAVGYSGPNNPYVFPAAANVPPHIWQGSIPSAANSTGIRLEGLDKDNGANWVLASLSDQTPNVLNPGVDTNGVAVAHGSFNWSHQNNHYSNKIDTLVGPFSRRGVYHYVGNYSNYCGNFIDSVTVFANLIDSNCLGAHTVISNETCTSIRLIWPNGPVHTQAAFGPVGFIPGLNQGMIKDTIVFSDTLIFDGLDPGGVNIVWVRYICGADTSAWKGPYNGSIRNGPLPKPRFSISHKNIGNQIQITVDAGASFNANEFYWEFGDGGPTGTGVIDSILLSQNEIIRIKLIAKNGCGMDSVTLFSLINISLDEGGSNNLQFDLYPNPTTGLINLNLNSQTGGDLKASIIDVNGKFLLSENLFLAKGSNSYSMDLYGYPKGLYFLVLQSDNGVWKRKVLVR